MSTLNTKKELKNTLNNEEYDEEILEDTLEKDFAKQIVERGRNYYYNDNVLHVYKNKNKYFGTVRSGTIHSNIMYNVEITIDNEDNAHYECSCPYEFPCKHEYATIIAISNKEYTEKKLKPIIKEKETDLNTIIKSIPSEELKNYLLSLNEKKSILLNIDSISNKFRKYCPKQKYEFYYNNLYNTLLLNDYTKNTKINNYIDKARQYLNNSEFEESFKIIKSIIEAYHDSDTLNIDDEIFDIISKLGIILRIIYRKANNTTKKSINTWKNKLNKQNYYDNYYLEDLILSLK